MCKNYLQYLSKKVVLPPALTKSKTELTAYTVEGLTVSDFLQICFKTTKAFVHRLKFGILYRSWMLSIKPISKLLIGVGLVK